MSENSALNLPAQTHNNDVDQYSLYRPLSEAGLETITQVEQCLSEEFGEKRFSPNNRTSATKRLYYLIKDESIHLSEAGSSFADQSPEAIRETLRTMLPPSADHPTYMTIAGVTAGWAIRNNRRRLFLSFSTHSTMSQERIILKNKINAFDAHPHAWIKSYRPSVLLGILLTKRHVSLAQEQKEIDDCMGKFRDTQVMFDPVQ